MSNAFDQTSRISGTISQSSEIFAVGDGTTVTFKLTAQGFPATRVDSVSAIHVTDWSGRHLLYSTPRTNFLSYSVDYTNAAWTKGATGAAQIPIVTANYAAAPDGTTTATRLQFELVSGATASDRSYVLHNGTVGDAVAGNPYMGELWIKAASAGEVGKKIALRHVARVGYTAFTVTADWTRISKQELSFNTQPYMEFGLRRDTVTPQLTLDVLVWNCQIEAGTVVTSDIVTGSTPATVTDYTVSGVNVTFASAPANKAILDWDGVGYSLVSGPNITYAPTAGALIEKASDLAIKDADAHLPVPIIVGPTIDHNAFGDSPTTDFYYKIWVLPPRTEIRNPPLNTNLPFRIWNAYPSPATNTIVNIVETDADGLTLDVGPGTVWTALETKQINLQVSETAGATIDAKFEFDFTVGVGVYEFVASLFSSLELVPENDVTETWEWKTDVRKAWSQAEQRAGIRSLGPRRTIEFSVVFPSEDMIRFQNSKLAVQLAGTVQVPYYQYSSVINQDAQIGDDTVFFDAAQTDLREGETCVVMSRDGQITPYDIKTLAATSATFTRQIAEPILKGALISPQFPAISTGNITNQRYIRNASRIKFSFRTDSPRETMVRPGTTVVLTMFNGAPVLDMRPVVESTADDEYDAGLKAYDSGVGLAYRYQSWRHYEISMPRKFLIRRRRKPDEMDWWRLFGETVDGSRVRFYSPTWRPDLQLIGATPNTGDTTFVAQGSNYSSEYYPYETYKCLSFILPDGTLWYAKVIQVVPNFEGSGNDQIQLDRAFTDASRLFTTVGFLLGCRIEDDRIQLQHFYLDSTVTINLRSADQ